MKYFKKMNYPLSTWGIVFGMVLAYIAFYYGNRMTMALYLERQDADAGRMYQQELSLNCKYDCSYDEFVSCFEDIPGNLTIVGMPLYVDKLDAEHIVSIILKKEEDTPYQFVEGEWPDVKEREKTLSVVLGVGCKKYVTSKDGKEYICICGEKYLVTGYVSAEHSSIYDNAILLFGNQLGKETKEAVDYYTSQMQMDLIFQSNTTNSNELLELIATKFKMQNVQYMVSDEIDMWWFKSEVGSRDYRMYAYLTYLFSVCVIIMVVQFWIIQRKREIAIRRLDGYNNWQIVKMLAVDIFKILMATSGVLVAIQSILQITNGEEIAKVDIFVQLLGILFFVLCTFILLLIYPFVKIMRGSIADAIQEGGRVH